VQTHPQEFVKRIKRVPCATDDDLVTIARRRFARGAALALAVTTTVATFQIASAGTAAAVADDDWLGIVNTYRAMSGLDPVGANDSWSSEAQAHSCYMLQNGISHDELPGRPGYTTGGDIAGNSGNVAVSSSISATARNHVDLWMTGPFHAIGILRHNLRTSGFGLCTSSTTTPWRSGGTLDVLRGLDSTPRPTTPTVFPGNGATVPLHSFVTEFPNPMTMCNWTGSAGLPLIALMPADVTAASASLTGPNGPVSTCVLHKGNVADSTGKAILDGDNGVIVMPREPLADGSYSVSVASNGGNADWSFTVDRDAPLAAQPPAPPPEPVMAAPATDRTARFQPVAPFRFVDTRIGKGASRLAAGTVTPIEVSSDPGVLAVSANFVSTGSNGAGFLTLYNCTTQRPDVSTLGFRPGGVVANQAFVPLQQGRICVYSPTDTDVVIDINGYYLDDRGSGFRPVEPVRLYDSRDDARGVLAPGEERIITVVGATPRAPSGSTAVTLNLTAIEPKGNGFVRLYPCGAQSGSEISSINFGTDEVRANTVVTPVATDGTVCLQSNVEVHLAVDLFGYFSSSGGFNFQPLSPVRMFDSRLPQSGLNEATSGQPITGGQTIRLQIAGRQGVPAGARAAAVNITTVDVGAATYVTAYPCGDRPLASNINITPSQAVTANGAMVKLSSDGALCLFTPSPIHLVVDINGVWL
jgi:hypothetical protein